MSRPKELDFFVPEKNCGRSLEWYEQRFGDAPIRGETSPSYTVHPFLRGVPQRIHSVVPEARLIYLVRDPIERIVSHYLHRVANHPSIGSFEQALADPEHGPGLIAYSRYWQQLEQFLAYFSEERILVVDTHNLKEQRESTMAQVFSFLGVDPAHRSPELRHRHNQADESGRLTVPGRLVLRGLNAALGPRRASRARELTPPRMRAQFRLPYERPVPSATVRAWLEDELRPEVERLRQHTGLPLADWSL